MSPRNPSHPINPLFIERWSPRSFREGEVTPQQLNTLFEAARWAPSAFNAQPWRFIYALKGSAAWQDFVGLLVEANQRWAANASALVFVVSKTTFQAPGKEPVPFGSHAFDTGAAWASLALQAKHDGLATHAMGGFDRVRARELLGVPQGYEFQAAVAIGHQGPADALPDDLRARELPSQREPLERLVADGRFSFNN
jgi:nitroreductase